MKFESLPKRCYMCSKPFSQDNKPIPVIGGKCTPGYICKTCYTHIFKKEELKQFQEIKKGESKQELNKKEGDNN